MKNDQPTKAEMLEDIFNNDLEFWLKNVAKQPKFAALKVALSLLEDNAKLSDEEVLEMWRKIS